MQVGPKTLGGRVAFDVPVEVAYAYLADPRNRPEWQASLSSVEMLDEGEPRVGMRWQDHTVVGLVPRMEITEMEPGELWVERGHWRAIEADPDAGLRAHSDRMRRGREVPGSRTRPVRTGGLARHRRWRAAGALRRTARCAHPDREEATMGRTLGLVLSALMVLMGVVFTFQGLGYIEGSAMTGVELWAILGPVIAGFGIALGIVVIRGGH